MSEHRIRYDESGNRQIWECECGAAGSVGEFGDVGIASEKHVQADESVIYVSGGLR